ncbi:beta-xylosidase [Clostridia bacterium]|nr:beta-xylosidase [Clostridia bacterium]
MNMKNNLKKLVLTALAALLCFVLFACSAAPETPGGKPDPGPGTGDKGANSLTVDGGASKSLSLVIGEDETEASADVTLSVTYADGAAQGFDISYTQNGAAVSDGIVMTEAGHITASREGTYVIAVKMKADASKSVSVTVAVTQTPPDLETARTLVAPVKPMRPVGTGSADFSTWGDYTQHDPGIFKDPLNGKYYTVGTNVSSMLESEDLMAWKSVNSNFFTPGQATEVRAWTGGNQLFWAPDLIVINGVYHFYYSITAGFGSPKSAIGLATAPAIGGPYTDRGVVVKSTGSSTKPNCIDPNVIRSKDGKLYMTYGSFSGGIFIFELDPATGKAKEAVGVNGDGVDTNNYGTKIAGGIGMEGPYISYNPETDYYYLFVSIIANPGNLSPSANLFRTYNVRVGRSRGVTGPYLDPEGNDMTALTNDKGSKIIGGYTFEADEGEVSRGWKAPGHNSVLNDDGTWYMVHHVRREIDNNEANANASDNPEKGPSYQVVRRMFFNEDGWPVVSPNKYGGEQEQKIGSQNLVGEWKVIKLIKENATCIHSVKATFNADKTVSGAYTGSFAATGGNKVSITLTESGVTTTYKGVAMLDWDYVNRKPVLAFTAVNENGVHLWGNRYLA